MVDVNFLDDGTLDLIIIQDVLVITYHIPCPLKYGVDIWKQIRNGNTASSQYEGSKMSERIGYNIMVLFNEKLGTSQHIRYSDGILEFAIEIDRGDKTRYSLMSVKVPIENCFDALDKIIEKYKKICK
jgi:hypothetical protein